MLIQSKTNTHTNLQSNKISTCKLYESVECRFLRPNKPWNPPEEIDKTILKICADNGLKEDSEFHSLDVKYTVLKACFDETGHGIPNSMLHTIETVGKLRQ